MKTIIYARTSTDKEEQNTSIPQQIELCKRYAEENGLEVVAVYQDEQSGKDLNRPGIRAALGALALGDAEILLVVDFDRVTRETGDIERLKKLIQSQGWKIYTLEAGEVDLSNGIGIFNAEIKTAASKYLRLQAQEKITRALNAKKSRGEKLGGSRPFGFAVLEENGVKKLVEDKREQNAIKLIFRLRDNGLSYAAICKELRRRKIKAANGTTKWNSMSIGRILKRSK